MQPEIPQPHPINFYAALLRVRPAQLCDVLKKLLRVRRRYVQSATGQTFWLDPVSVLGLHLMSEGLHEPQMCKLFESVLRPGDCVIDVGGNEGYFSVSANRARADLARTSKGSVTRAATRPSRAIGESQDSSTMGSSNS